ncbi:hypothetical protein [Emticicia sp. BO119]|uniref:hypothetical protein n=1 Tax=Emticicia sp. BO119 TaxID=2757768 RepID=UPI0015F0F4A7|nr:hypothetical protein [Emticicia sp. BO119]MBA4849111.1 hypothetical protein [Emticicia sp. BO119]
MHLISIWAGRNTRKAISLIVIFEFVKSIIGFSIGHNFLPGLSTSFIETAVLGLVFLITFVQANYKYQSQKLNKEVHRRLRLTSTGLLFLSSLFLSILLGNQLRGLGYSTNSFFAAKAAVTIPSDSIHTTTTSLIVQKSNRPLKHKFRLFSKKTADDDPYSNRRIGYVLLFLLSLVLTYIGVYLTCGVLCSGYGVLALLIFLTSLGVLSGGIYFLIKAFSHPVKPISTMSGNEKRKERRKFLLTWGILSLATAIFLLITNSSN